MGRLTEDVLASSTSSGKFWPYARIDEGTLTHAPDATFLDKIYPKDDSEKAQYDSIKMSIEKCTEILFKNVFQHFFFLNDAFIIKYVRNSIKMSS